MSENMSKIPMLVVALVVGIIMVTTAVIPLVSDYSDAKTFTNTGLIYATPITADTDTTLLWEYAHPNQITKDTDTVIPLPTDATFPLTIAFSETWLIRADPGTSGYSQVYIDTSGAAVIAASVANNTDMLIELTGSTIVITVGETVKTYDVNGGLVINPTGEYVLKKSNDLSYFGSDSTAYVAGYTYHPFDGTGSIVNIFSYTQDGGVDIWGIYPADATHTETVTESDIDGFIGLVKLEKINMAITNSSEDTGNVTYNQFYVPVEVTADPANPDQYKALVSVLPILAIVGLIAVAAGAMIIKGKR